jgi:hypothetical protein
MYRALIFGIGILSALALGACSTTPSHTAVRTASAVVAGSCPATAGTSMRPRIGECKAYSHRQLVETGQTANLARALQMLDPSITASGH